MKLFFIFCLFYLCYFGGFAQNLNDVQPVSANDELRLSYGLAFSDRSADGSISAFHTSLVSDLIDLLPTHSLNRLTLELHINNYVPLSNRSTANFKNSTQYGLGLSYLFHVKNRREVFLGFTPFITQNYFRYQSNELSYLALQFELRLPIIHSSETSRSLYAGFAYTTTPIVYNKSESKYDFLRFFMSIGF